VSSKIEYLDDINCPLIDESMVSYEEVESLYVLQRDILEGVALGSNYLEALDKLCHMAEEMVPKSLASIMLLNAEEVLEVASAPSIPSEGIDALNGLVPGPNAGSCGTTVYNKTPTFVTDVMTDPRWACLRPLAKSFGLGACWSMPIKSQNGQVIGSFALTGFQIATPNRFQRRILDTCAYIIGIVIQKRRSEEALDYRLQYDALTGLPNRDKFRLDVNAMTLQEEAFQLLILGVNRFKSINDSHGHNIGDFVLKELTHRLNNFSSEFGGCLYRIGGDEFVCVIPASNLSTPRVIEQSIHRILKPSFSVEFLELYVSMYGGMSHFDPESPTSFFTLMKQADMALHSAKYSSYQDIVEFEPEMSEKVVGSLALEGDLRHALQEELFEVYYQPIISTETHQVNNLEALVRWNHPTKGLISPSKFIFLAEEMGIIHHLTLIVLKMVISDLRDFNDNGMTGVVVSVNISGNEFNRVQITELIGLVLDSELGSQIEFELTESYLIGNANEAMDLLDLIRNSGIKMAIDDFGTGYSSLSYLKRFHVDKLKIDQSLIRDIAIDDGDLHITRAVVTLAHGLGLKVVAEGVENHAIQSLLEGEKVDFLQGYLYSKPKTKTQIIQTIKRLDS